VNDIVSRDLRWNRRSRLAEVSIGHVLIRDVLSALHFWMPMPTPGGPYQRGRETADAGIHLACLRKLTPEHAKLVRRLLDERKSVREIADTFNVHTATIYRLSATRLKCIFWSVASGYLISSTRRKLFAP
jgi:Helix-turn-helix domain